MPNTYSVLVIDDSAEIRIILTRFLKTFGFEKVDAAENGRIGVDKSRLLKPDIIFLDGVMPEMDGITALPQIKKESPNSIVIVSSSLTEKARILQFKEAGADFYLLKPYEREKFEDVVRTAIAFLEDRQRSLS